MGEYRRVHRISASVGFGSEVIVSVIRGKLFQDYVQEHIVCSLSARNLVLQGEQCPTADRHRTAEGESETELDFVAEAEKKKKKKKKKQSPQQNRTRHFRGTTRFCAACQLQLSPWFTGRRVLSCLSHVVMWPPAPLRDPQIYAHIRTSDFIGESCTVILQGKESCLRWRKVRENSWTSKHLQ